jgi:predicted nucleic acid-binding protein
MIVLDTNVVSELFRPRPDVGVVAWLAALTDQVSVTAITAAELQTGVRRLPDGARKATLTRGMAVLLDDHRRRGTILPFDGDAAAHSADISAARERLGRPISSPDAQIAAICRSRSATCATRNVEDFTASGIELINPWELGH